MKNRLSIIGIMTGIALITSCKKEDDQKTEPVPVVLNTIPEFYKEAEASVYGKILPEFTFIAGTSSGISIPQDIDFHPTRPNELWIVNKGTEFSGGTTVTIDNPGEASQVAKTRKDGNAYHFMSLPSALAFSNNGNWATSANVLDANHGNGRYTGPTLWSSDLSIYAVVGNPATQTVNGSHLDMVHQSPYTMGIASETDNVFWAFDGYYGNIIRYDFAADHGPGNDYHGDAKLKRYNQVNVKRTAEVPSHLILDAAKKWLYIVDGGNKRILRMDITTGVKLMDLPPVSESLAEYIRMTDVTWEVFADQNLQQPCGIDIKDNRLFVSDYESGEIICFDVDKKSELGRVNTGEKGIAGVKIYNGSIWYVNAIKNTCNRVTPK